MTTIDADGHVIEPADLWQRELPAPLRERGFAVRWNDDSRQEEVHLDGRLLLPFGIVGVGMAGRPFDAIGTGVRYGELMPGGFDPRQRLRDMDAEGIDVAVLYPSIGLFLAAIEDPVLAAASCRVYNDWLADYCRAAPRRLIGVAAVPMQDVDAAARELRRACDTLGMRGAFLRPNPCNGRALHDPYFDPFWRTAAELGVPIGLHPSGAGDLPGALQGLRLDAPIMGHPSIFFIDAFIGFSHLVCGGVLERHPTLTVVVLEAGGGWLGHWFDRFDHFAQVYGWMAPELRLKPSEYFQRQCYVSFDPDETTLPLLAPLIGERRIVWASDYPHLDATFPGVVRELEAHLRKLPAAAQDRIRGANAAALYGLNV
ncbi:MAG: amidohydrolase family protein [Deltaproteobacteria bacterium]|nr:amidohydrolase family protein [Deltaproteobacteria bacterium]